MKSESVSRTNRERSKRYPIERVFTRNSTVCVGVCCRKELVLHMVQGLLVMADLWTNYTGYNEIYRVY